MLWLTDFSALTFCYFLVAQNNNWTDDQSYCETQYAVELVTIENIVENLSLRAFLDTNFSA